MHTRQYIDKNIRDVEKSLKRGSDSDHYCEYRKALLKIGRRSLEFLKQIEAEKLKEQQDLLDMMKEED